MVTLRRPPQYERKGPKLEPAYDRFLLVDYIKTDMSEYDGNLVFVDRLRAEWDPRAIRLAIIEHHYRREWEWEPTLMPRNGHRLEAWSSAARHGGSDGQRVLDDVRLALDDDLDTPSAVAAIDAAAAAGHDVRSAAALLGVVLAT